MNEDINKMFELLLEGQKEIKEQIKRVHERLDDISEKATINEQSIRHIEKSFDEEKTETKNRFDIVHASIRRRDGTLKWLFASIIIPIGLALVAIFRPQ